MSAPKGQSSATSSKTNSDIKESADTFTKPNAEVDTEKLLTSSAKHSNTTQDAPKTGALKADVPKPTFSNTDVSNLRRELSRAQDLALTWSQRADEKA